MYFDPTSFMPGPQADSLFTLPSYCSASNLCNGFCKIGAPKLQTIYIAIFLRTLYAYKKSVRGGRVFIARWAPMLLICGGAAFVAAVVVCSVSSRVIHVIFLRSYIALALAVHTCIAVYMCWRDTRVVRWRLKPPPSRQSKFELEMDAIL